MLSAMKSKKRIVWIDIGRVLAIYLVVVVHTTSSPQILPMLGVPLFVMLSGSMLLGKSESYLEFWSKRLLRLLRPWIFWAVVISIFDIFIYKSSLNLFFSIARSNFVTIWFMPMIFGLYLLTPALRVFVRSAKNRDLWIVIALWFMTISVLPFFRNTAAFPVFSDNGFVRQVELFFGYYLLGFAMIKKYWWGKNINFALIIIGFLVTVVMGGARSLFISYQAPGIVLMACGFFGLLSNFGDYFQKIINGNTGKFLTAVSKTSLGVYLIHLQVIRLLPVNKYFGSWISGAILFCLSFPAILFLQKVPILKKWVA
jgi:surface polysaccharide O-acyltransferase-like enzyme